MIVNGYKIFKYHDFIFYYYFIYVILLVCVNDTIYTKQKINKLLLFFMYLLFINPSFFFCITLLLSIINSVITY